jgi:murein L,D-transpeptidase YcbB/YkuD
MRIYSHTGTVGDSQPVAHAAPRVPSTPLITGALVCLCLTAAVGHAVPRTQGFAAAATKKVSSAASSSSPRATSHSSGSNSSPAKTANAKTPLAGTAAGKAAAAKTSVKRGKTNKSISRKTAKEHGPAAPTSERISEIQSALATQGAFQGDPNGRWDNSTIDAMKHFQAAHGLNPSGKLDALTLQKLGLGSEVAGRGAPLPPPPPETTSAIDNRDPQLRP